MGFRNQAAALARAIKVDGKPTRVDRGLPQHADGSGFAPCPDCEGAGEQTHNDSHDGDPQQEYGVECERCHGDGQIEDGEIDVLLRLRRARSATRRTRMPHAHYFYGRLIARAFSPPPYLP